MSGYQRLISYIYAYEGGIKGKNIGFAKIENRGSQCRIMVSVKKIFVGGNPIGIYLMAGQEEVRIGTLFARGNAGEFRTVVNAQDVEGSGHRMEEFFGLTVHDTESAWRSYTTIWEDAVAHAAEIELAEVTSEKIREREAEKSGERGCGAAKESENAEKKKNTEETERSESTVREPEISASGVKEPEGPGAAAGESGVSSSAVKEPEGPGAAAEEPGSLASAAKEPEGPGAAAGEPGIFASAAKESEGPGAAAGESGVSSSGMKEPEGPETAAGESGVSASAAKEPEVSASGVKEPEGPGAAAGEPGVSASVAKEAEAAAAAVKGPESLNGASGAAAERGTGPKLPISEEIERELEREELNRLGILKIREKNREPGVLKSQRRAEKEAGKIRREMLQEKRPADPMPPSSIPVPYCSAADLQKEQEAWEMFRGKYSKILAFDYADGCEILAIKPQDIGLLPRENWIYGNNSFLLHGYYNYRHLILARLNQPGGRGRYLLGVPGHYQSNERYMASMFGFSDFVLSKRQPPRDSRFGYWYTDIQMGN